MDSSLRLTSAVTGFLRDYLRVCLTLCRVMLPIIVLMKVIDSLGAVELLAAPLGPLMKLVGLPAEMGLVWASAMLGNLYTGMVVLQAVLPATGPLSLAQTTVLAVLMLIAHNMVLECRIAQSCGVSFWGQFALRVCGGLVCAGMLWQVLSAGGLLAGPAALLWAPPSAGGGLAAWAVGEVRNLGSIFLVILALMAFMRALNALGVSKVIERVLSPFLKLMGIGDTAATITVIGMVMGLAYGGGLIIHEVSQGKISKSDVFAAVSLMSLSHAVIEDTLLMALIGASAWGTLGARLVFSLAAIALLSRILRPGRV